MLTKNYPLNMRLLRRLATLLLLCGVCQLSYAEAGPYYWYHNHVEAFPFGKGVVYATNDADKTPAPEEFSADTIVKYCVEDDAYAPFYVYNIPAEGYGFNGWYLWDADQGKARFVTRGNVMNRYYWELIGSNTSEDSDSDSYGDEPRNNIFAMFGRVNCAFAVDNLEELKALSVPLDVMLSTISKPPLTGPTMKSATR